MKQRLLAVALCVFCSVSCIAQVATGTPQFQTFSSGGPDVINIGNLNIHWSVPILKKLGRGQNFAWNVDYDSSIYYPVMSSGSVSWQPVSGWGWHGFAQVPSFISYSSSYSSGSCGQYGQGWYKIWSYSNFVYWDEYGTPHYFNAGGSYMSSSGDASCPANSGANPPGTIQTKSGDGSGLSMYFSISPNSPTAYISTSNGMYKYPPLTTNATPPAGASYSSTDSNGNQITGSNGVFTDTTGHTALTVSGVAPSNTVFSYANTSGNQSQVSVSYAPYNIHTYFQCGATTEYTQTGAYLVDKITLPDNSYYQFHYESSGDPNPAYSGYVSGRLASVTLPTGGIISYAYTGGNHGIVCSDGSTAGLTRTLNSDSGSAASTWTYSRTPGSNSSHTEVVDGNSNHQEYDFSLSSALSSGTTANYYETARSIYQGAASGTPLLSRQTCYVAFAGSSCTTTVPSTLGKIDVTETLDGITTHGWTTWYDGVYGLQTESDVYDFGSAAGTRGGLLRKEVWTLYGSTLPSVVTDDAVYDGASNLIGHTAYQYDQTAVTASSAPQHVAPNGARGNLTTLKQYASSGTFYTSTFTYEDTGSVLTSTTPNGTTTYSYDPTFVYQTGVSYPTPSSGVAISSGAAFDTSYTGLPLSVTDPNGKSTSVSTYDTMFRPTLITRPDGGWTSYTYSAVQTSSFAFQNSSVNVDTENLVDSYGRQSRRSVSNAAGTNQFYEADTCYDANGNVSGASYAYQSAGWGSAKRCTSGDTYTYDALGRVKIVTRANNETIVYTYAGRATQITDENNAKRISQVDGLGRVSRVCEITSNADQYGSPGSCGTDIPGTGWVTSYSYNLSTGTTTVTQSAQTRTFQSDWLGRTTFVQEPERGQTTYGYAYNSTGLAVTRVRPKANQASAGVTTTSTMQYDKLGRLVSVTYSDGTPSRTYTYDVASEWGATLQNPKGRMAQAWSSANAGAIFSYDAMGRVLSEPQCTPSKCGTGSYGPTYTYDWQGNVLTASNGDGYTNTYTYTRANEVQSITSSLNDASHPPALLSSVQNGPYGPVNWHLGNGLNGVRSYDSLGRVTGGWVCNGSTQASCTGGTQVYGFTSSWTGVRETGESDTVLSKTITHGYDEFNRLTSRTVTSGTAENYTYLYDRYGNRVQQNALNGGFTSLLMFDPSTNHITTAGFQYDAAGNMINDGSHSYTYDAEGNLTAIDGGSTASFVYDALNRRVRVNKGATSTEFVFNLNSQRASAWNASGGTLVQGHTYWGTTPVEFYSNGYAQFQHQDWLGTERMRTKYNGVVDGTFQSLPYGEGLTISGADNDAAHFATLDRDYYSTSSTTGTDHADFRQYGPSQGRWMSPDPYYGSYNPSNPQSMNRYVYALNSPQAYVDHSGLDENNNCPDGLEGCFGSTSDPFLTTNGSGPLPLPDPFEVFIVADYGPTNIPMETGGSGNAPNNAPKPIDWKKVGSCLVDSTLNHYGLTGLTAASGALAIPISKSLVPPFRMIGEPTTNLLSVLGHYVEINVPRITIDGLASTNLLRIAGRANPYVAGALLAIDVGMISYDTYQCYQKQ